MHRIAPACLLGLMARIHGATRRGRRAARAAGVGDEVATRRDVQGATVCRTPFKRLIISIRCSTLPFLRFVILIYELAS